MPRDKKDARPLNIKLDSTIHDRLDEFCHETGVTKTAATEKMVSMCLDEYFSRPVQERQLIRLSVRSQMAVG